MSAGRPRLVVALDLPDADTARRAAAGLRGHADLVKIGLELFVAAGPALAEELRDAGWGVFLDLKFHDIPATVAGAVRSATALGVELLTLHVAGGAPMIEAAVAARGDATTRLLGVTLLTSLDAGDLRRLGFEEAPGQVVDRMAAMAHDSGCDGVVASAREAAAIKRRHGEGFLVVTPGIRPAGTRRGDQARVAGVAEAVRAGADYLVVGRPILQADDAAAAAAAIRDEIEGASAAKHEP